MFPYFMRNFFLSVDSFPSGLTESSVRDSRPGPGAGGSAGAAGASGAPGAGAGHPPGLQLADNQRQEEEGEPQPHPQTLFF